MITINCKLTFALFLFVLAIKSNAQSDCKDAITVCGNTNFKGFSVTGIGTQELSSQTNTCSSQENNSIWLKIAINTGGTLGFTLIPESNNINEDFDFFVFGPNATCNALGQAIRCSTTNPKAINQSDNHTGMNDLETDTAEGPGFQGNSYVKWLTVSDGDSFFLVIDRPIGSSNFSLQWIGTATFNVPPQINIPSGNTLNISLCDADGIEDFSTAFDLTKNTPIITGTQTDVIVSYHALLNDALTNANPISNPHSYINIINQQPIYTRITNSKTSCFNTSEFTLNVTNTINFPSTKSYLCDDDMDGNNSNGRALFDLNKVTADIFQNQDTSPLNVKYYLTQNEADANINELPRYFYNTTAHQQFIYIKAFSQKLCVSTARIELIVIPLPPSVNAALVQCDIGVAPDGISLFNLNEANSLFTNNQSHLSTAYFKNNSDASSNTNPLPTNFSNEINPQTIVVRVTNSNTACYNLSYLTLKVNVIPEQTYPITPVCDIDEAENGIQIFNLNDANIPITNTQTIAYYENSDDALLEQNAIQTPLKYRNQTAYNQIVYARIEDKNDCFGISKIILEVKKLPHLEVNSTAFVCPELPNILTSIDAGLQEGLTTDYTYIWSKNGTVIPGKTAYTLDINTDGQYSVEVTNAAGCSKIRDIKAIPSGIAHIESIQVVDMSEVNSLSIIVTGTGVYEYSLDEPIGHFQDSNFFNNVPSGIHEVFVNDKNGCGPISRTIAFIGIPKFFTPNNDGFNDYWSPKEINKTFNSEATIYIFDRFGKLLKQWIPSSNTGWDGTFNGKELPSDDYWYTIKLEDGREVKGSFTLKR